MHINLEKILAFLRRDKNFPLILFLLALLSFGILIPRLGLYSDDWHYFWLSYRLDFIARFFSRNRPFLGSIYDVINDLIGPSLLQWHIVFFLLKWSAAVALWQTLKCLFPTDSEKAKWICLLFAFYPGNLILFQPLVFMVAVLQLNCLFLSFYLNIVAIQKPAHKGLILILSLAASLINLVASEYFFFLELLRPLVIWAALSPAEPDGKKRRRKTLREWLPYLVMFSAVVIWRFLAQNSLSSHQVWLLQDFFKQPVETLFAFIQTVIRSTGQLFITAWNNRLLQDQIYEPQRIGITIYFLALVIFSARFLFGFFFKPDNNKVEQQARKSENWWLELAGLAAIFLGGLPIWLSKYNLDFTFRTENRFVLPFMLGVSISLVGFTYALFRDKLTRTFCLTAAVAVGLGFQFLTANLYRQETENLKQFYWQLQWRAPSLQTGIHLISNPPPFTMEGENSLSAGINWVYGRNEAAKQIDYYLYFNPQRIQKEIGPLVKDKPIHVGHQIGDFSGSRLQLLAFRFSPPGCLQMVNPALAETFTDLPAYVYEAALNSDLGLIDAPSSELNISRLQEIFGQEPVHNWCYYFEKADLARQMEDWVQIGKLYEQVLNEKLQPEISMEWSPFIEGIARLHNWPAALSLSQQITSNSKGSYSAVCSLWSRVLSASKPDNAESNKLMSVYLKQINCSPG